jgi:hypothetical protein
MPRPQRKVVQRRANLHPKLASGCHPQACRLLTVLEYGNVAEGASVASALWLTPCDWGQFSATPNFAPRNFHTKNLNHITRLSFDYLVGHHVILATFLPGAESSPFSLPSARINVRSSRPASSRTGRLPPRSPRPTHYTPPPTEPFR